MKDCVSLEMAKLLKEAGWKQEDHCGCDSEILCDHPHQLHYGAGNKEPGYLLCMYLRKEKAYGRGCYAAPTVVELLEALPKGIDLHKERDDETAGEYSCGLDPTLEEGSFSSVDWYYSANPADALALLWLALREKNLV